MNEPDSIAELQQLAVAHHLAGRFPEAEPLYRQILKVEPQHVNALQLLGTLAHQTGRSKFAVELLEQAIALDGARSAFHANLGNAFRALGRLEEAEASGRRAVELQDDYAEAHNNLGVTLQQMKRWPEAASSFLKATKLKPDYVDAYANLGLVMRLQGEHRKAIAAYLRALRYKPNHFEAHYGLARSLKEQGRIAEALVSYDQVLRLKPDYAEAYNNRGAALLGQLRLDEGLADFNHAIRLKPDLADAHLNLALGLLQTGDYERGWLEYEWRKKAPGASPRLYPQPEWRGEPLAGKSVLAHAEQGLGDTIQFVRYLPLLKARGARVVLECQKVLFPLLRNFMGDIDEFLPAGDDPPAFDYHIPLMSFPVAFRTTVDTIPAEVPYLRAEPVRAARWRDVLSTDSAFKIGIAWQGNASLADDRLRSIPLRHFAAVAAVPGAKLISLQKGPGAEQLAIVDFECADLAERLDPPGEAFLDTAAVMSQLDLVISADTSLAHLGGALGVPTWVALMYAPDWRWLLDRDDSPWYPTVRLFRQTLPGDWPDLFAEIAREVRMLATAKTWGPVQPMWR